MPIGEQHAQAKAKTAQWQRCRDVYDGSDAVKARRELYLPRNPGWDDAKYSAYVTRALFYNAMGRTVEGLTGLVFSKNPSVFEAAPDVKLQFDDVTQTGVSLAGLAVQLCNELLVVGRGGVLIDAPPTPTPGAARPYWVPYRAEQILDWRAQRFAGASLLTRLVLFEEAEEPKADDEFAVERIAQLRLYRLVAGRCQVTVWRKVKDKFVEGNLDADGKWTAGAPPTEPLRLGKPLPWIPFTFFNPESISPDVEPPPLIDLVDVNLSDYRTSADLEWGRHWCGLPTPWAAGYKGTDVLEIGSSKAWVFEDPSAKASMLEFTGQGLGALERAREEKRNEMATLGARLLEVQKKGFEAAETVRLRHSGESSALSLLAGALGRGLTQVARRHAWWAGVDDAAAQRLTVQLNPDLMDRMTPEEITALVATWQAGAVSKKTLYYNLERGKWTRPDVGFEEEEEAIDAEGGKEQDGDPDLGGLDAAGVEDMLAARRAMMPKGAGGAEE